MSATTASAHTRFRKRLDKFYAQAAHEAVIITLPNNQDRVLISKQEYESLLKRAHLLPTAANAVRLRSATEEIEAEIARRSATP